MGGCIITKEEEAGRSPVTEPARLVSDRFLAAPYYYHLSRIICCVETEHGFDAFAPVFGCPS